VAHVGQESCFKRTLPLCSCQLSCVRKTVKVHRHVDVNGKNTEPRKAAKPAAMVRFAQRDAACTVLQVTSVV
jgi:hypothetical protein